jgi:uncharacterized membrane protein YoaK (UPF0700 family)
VNVVFLAVLLGGVAVLALLTALVAITAPVLGRLIARIAPRLVWEASFIATWLVVKAGR